VISFDLLSKYLLIMELPFDAMLYSNLVTKILTKAASNFHAGRRFPTPALNVSLFKAICLTFVIILAVTYKSITHDILCTDMV